MADEPSGAQWNDAEMTWAPEFSPESATLEIPLWADGYAALMIEQDLPDVLRELSNGEAQVWKVSVLATERHGAGDLPGAIRITAERLTEQFDPAELRERVDDLVGKSILEGNAAAERDEKRAREFLAALAEDPARE